MHYGQDHLKYSTFAWDINTEVTEVFTEWQLTFIFSIVVRGSKNNIPLYIIIKYNIIA
jgi:hypothetical protein